MKEKLFITPVLMDGIGTLNAAVKNIAAQTGTDDPKEALRRFNSGEWILTKPERQWREEGGVIYFSVTSNGMTGLEWEKYLDEKGFNLGDYGKSLLRSDDFVPAEKGTVHDVAVLKGMLFEDGKRATKTIRAEADRRDLKHGKDIHPEIACLIRDNFSDEELKEMGLWAIIVFHEPIEDSDSDPRLLVSDRRGDGRWLDAYYDDPDNGWSRGDGFACVVSQVSPEA